MLAEKVSVAAPDHARGASGVPQGATSASDDEEFRPKSHIDFSKPFATNLKDETMTIHEELHHSTAAGALVNGQLAKSEYIRFLFMLWHIYECVIFQWYSCRELFLISEDFCP